MYFKKSETPTKIYELYANDKDLKTYNLKGDGSEQFTVQAPSEQWRKENAPNTSIRELLFIVIGQTGMPLEHCPLEMRVGDTVKICKFNIPK